MDLHTLREQTTAQLQDQWNQIGIRGDPPHFKQALVRGIAWHLQSIEHGNLDAETRRLLKAAIRNAPDSASRKRGSRSTKDRSPFNLPEGTTLVRTWHGHRHEVRVLEAGKRFRYRDLEYASLSEIAREITGARWSGPRFFGLKKIKQPA
tara:strand:- start:34695 stop:35144 length:450 start_codon:yes stop_codon:yes gene_type:complete